MWRPLIRHPAPSRWLGDFQRYVVCGSSVVVHLVLKIAYARSPGSKASGLPVLADSRAQLLPAVHI